MSSTDTVTVDIPAADTAEGELWREILAVDTTTSAVVPAGNSGMLMGGSALTPPALTAKVGQADIEAGAGSSTNTLVGKMAFYSLIRVTAKGRAVCVDDLRKNMDKYRHLADDDELGRWVLHSLMVYVLALWIGYNNSQEVLSDIKVLQQKLAGIRADIAG